MDVFLDEQKVYDNAINHIDAVKNGADYGIVEYEALADEYGKLLTQIRTITRFADRTTVNNLDLSGKVNHDELTGIYNRRFAEENLRHHVKSLSRFGGLLSVMMIDIDFFKQYNDTYGHTEGDVCLKAIAQTLSGCVTRENDFVARYGGEEFLVALPGTDEYGARITAKKLLESVRKRGIPHEKNTVADCVTISIGVTTVKAIYTHNYTDYIKRADEAMYISKQNGRNQYKYLDFMGV